MDLIPVSRTPAELLAELLPQLPGLLGMSRISHGDSAGASVVPNAAIVRVAQCRAHGDYAICTAAGNVNRPVSLHVYVSAFPGQQVSGAWDVVCSKGTGAGSRSGTFSGRGTGRYPLKRQLRMPYAAPDSCTVAADAQLSGTGDLIHVWIMAQRR